jgi:hypothetical protein
MTAPSQPPSATDGGGTVPADGRRGRRRGRAGRSGLRAVRTRPSLGHHSEASGSESMCTAGVARRVGFVRFQVTSLKACVTDGRPILQFEVPYSPSNVRIFCDCRFTHDTRKPGLTRVVRA